MKPLIILTGPTAVGKTKLSIMLAKKLNAGIISADSMQVYRGMDIGTAKIRPDEMQDVPHYMIDEFDPDEEFNVTVFKERTEKYIDEILAKGMIPMLVGGTGFYIRAVLYGTDFSSGGEDENDDGTVRKELYEFYEKEGRDRLFEELLKVDPEYTKVIHKNNIKKVVRGIEYFRLTGKKFSEYNEREKMRSPQYDYRYFVIENDRSIIHENINRRVDIMLSEGLENEVRGLLEKGYGKELVSMQGLGYKEMIEYLEGKCSLSEAAEHIKTGTRRFARRQETWFKREQGVIPVDIRRFKDAADAAEFCFEQCKDLTVR